MRFTNGWVKIHRKMFSDEWLELLDGQARWLLVSLIGMANIQPTRYLRKGHVEILDRGQLLTSDGELSASTGLSRKVIRKRLEVLTQTQTITLKRDNEGTLITICNYNKYQDTGYNEGTTKGQRRDNEGTTEGTRIKEVKEVKKKKKLKKEVPEDSNESLGPAIWDRYVQNMSRLYGHAPPRNAKTNSQCKKFGEYLGQIAVECVDVFFQVPNEYYKRTLYSLDVMLSDYAKLALAYKQKHGSSNEHNFSRQI